MLKVYPYNILGASLHASMPTSSQPRSPPDGFYLCYFYIGYFLKEHYSNNNNAVFGKFVLRDIDTLIVKIFKMACSKV